MKFCPKCGQQLDDDAIVCPRCGASQENSSNAVYSTKFKDSPTVSKSVEQSDSSQQHIEINPEIYNDPSFSKYYKLRKIKSLLSLTMILIIVNVILVLFLPFFTFNGVNVGDPTLISSYPVTFSIVEHFKYGFMHDTGANNLYFNFAPESIVNMPAIVLALGAIVPAVIALMGLASAIPSKKGLATALTVSKKQVKRHLNMLVHSILGGFAGVMSIATFIYMHSVMQNVEYVYTDGRRYALGEIIETKGMFAAGLSVSIITTLIVVATGIVFNIIFVKNLEE